MMPGVVINDPVETPYIGGGLDIWVVKQAYYEKYLAEHQFLQELGEEMWVYSCGFPSGKTMNRVLDLPLTASRLHTWMRFITNCWKSWVKHYSLKAHCINFAMRLFKTIVN